MVAEPLSRLLSFPSSASGAAEGDGHNLRSASKSFLPPPAHNLLVTSTISSPGLFLLIQFSRSALLDTKSPTPVVWVGCDASGVMHLAAIARKAGVNLGQAMQKKTFRFVDAAEVALESQTGAEMLQELQKLIEVKLREVTDGRESTSGASGMAQAMIIIDDVTSLCWSLPVSPSESNASGDGDASSRLSGRFIASLRRKCQSHSATLVTHALLPSASRSASTSHDAATMSLFNRLYRTASVWIQVQDLLSGRARHCEGEIVVHTLASRFGEGSDIEQGVAARGIGEDFDIVDSPAKGRHRAMLFNIGNDGSTYIWARGGT